MITKVQASHCDVCSGRKNEAWQEREMVLSCSHAQASDLERFVRRIKHAGSSASMRIPGAILQLRGLLCLEAEHTHTHTEGSATDNKNASIKRAYQPETNHLAPMRVIHRNARMLPLPQSLKVCNVPLAHVNRLLVFAFHIPDHKRFSICLVVSCTEDDR